MKTPVSFIGLLLLSFSLQSLIVREDVPDEKFIALAKQFPQICHLPMGEGALISSSWIITAGHIGRDLDRDMNSGYSPKVKCNEKEYEIGKVINHPDFMDTPDGIINDIALIKVKGDIKDVRPANIYSESDEKGEKIFIVGMGDIGTGVTGPVKWDKITRAATNIIDGADSLWIRFTFDSPATKVATEYEGVSGPGDSGGPAFIMKGDTVYLAGISSHQVSPHGKGRYGATEFYSRVSRYAKWIKEVIEEKKR